MSSSSSVKKVALAYSGGLDTSVILKWLQDTYACEVVTFTADIGQKEDLSSVRGKAEALSLVKETIPEPGALAYVRQQEPLGLGHAVWCGRNFVGSEPVAVLLADDLILNGVGCLKQMIDAYEKVGGNIVAVMEVQPAQTANYGVITPGDSDGRLVEVRGLVEKPRPEDAPSNLVVIGRYILQPGVFADLGRMEPGRGGEIQLTDALACQLGMQPFNGLKFDGRRFDCGSKVGFLEANLAFALDRDDMRADVAAFLQTYV